MPSLYDIYYYLPSRGGPTDRTIGVTGAVRGAMAGGPLVLREGEVIEPMRAILYRRPDLNVPVAVLNHAWGHTFQDRLADIGEGEVYLANDDPDLTDVWTHSTAVRFEIENRAAMTFLVENIEHVAIDPGEEHEEVTHLSGRSNIAVLDESVVYPSRGPGSKPFADRRLFSWPSPEFNDTGWTTPEIMTYAGAAPPENEGWWNRLADWPDPTAAWIWAPGNDTTFAPAGVCYFRRTFMVPQACTVRVFYTVDNGGPLYFDGIFIDENDSLLYTSDTPIEVSAGWHTIAIEGQNPPLEEGGTINPAGVLCSVIVENADESLGDVLMNTGSVGGGVDAWRGVFYPPTPPGMTPGEVIRHAVTEAQARGCHPEVRLAFTDEVDSDGNPWPVVGDISTKIGTTSWVFIGEELASTYVDVWMSPGDFTLYAWVRGKRGEVKDVTFAGSTVDEFGNMRGLTHRVAR